MRRICDALEERLETVPYGSGRVMMINRGGGFVMEGVFLRNCMAGNGHLLLLAVGFLGLYVVFVRSPVCGIVFDVLANFFQFVIVTNDSVIERLLPSEKPCTEQRIN